MKRSIGELRIETSQIAKLLIALGDGDVLTYGQIQQATGVNVQNGHRGLLKTAIKHAETETKRLYGTVFNVGVKRLVPGHSTGELTKSRDHIRRTARRAFNRSSNVDFEKLTADERTQLNAERTILHFAAEATADKHTKKLVGAVEKAGDAMTFAKTLEHFK